MRSVTEFCVVEHVFSALLLQGLSDPQQVFPTQRFYSRFGQRANSFVQNTKPLLSAVMAAGFFCHYLFGTSSPACRPAASPAAASPPTTCAPTPATGAAKVSEVDLQLRCDVVGWFAEMVVTGLVSGGLLIKNRRWPSR